MSKNLDTEVRAALTRHKGNWFKIAYISGVSAAWVSQFQRGLILNPGIQTLRDVMAGVRKFEKRETSKSERPQSDQPSQTPTTSATN